MKNKYNPLTEKELCALEEYAKLSRAPGIIKDLISEIRYWRELAIKLN